MTSLRMRFLVVPVLLALLLVPFACLGLSTTTTTTFRRCFLGGTSANHYDRHSFTAPMFATTKKKQSKTSDLSGDAAALLEEEETPAGVAGAEVFGGNRQKEELFDAEAEAKADSVLAPDKDIYNRFADSQAFSNELASSVAESLQSQINSVLYEEDDNGDLAAGAADYSYAPNLKWETPLSVDKSSENPLQELENALEFYNRIDVAIISASSPSPSTVVARWEISLMWPNFWEARVLVSGSSTLSLDGNTIVKQTDVLDQGDVLTAIGPQVIPRFWDTYHIGMTPSAEIMPRLSSDAAKKKGLLSSYKLYEIPARLVLRPSLLDIGTREDAYAQVIPNHAFSTTIKTMGPKRQRYVATSPVEIQISRDASSSNPRISWTIPLAVELLSNSQLPIPGDDPETLDEACAECQYEYQSRRRVATVPYGGFPQDAQVAEVRTKLYDQVVKDGLKPKLDDSGRPQFFYVQNDAKACYTEGGLGMAVYDWRPQFVKANEVGMELELE